MTLRVVVVYVFAAIGLAVVSQWFHAPNWVTTVCGVIIGWKLWDWVIKE